VIYTTNAIEALNRQLRKAIKTKGHFPNRGGRPQTDLSRDHQRRAGVDANAELDDSPARVQDPLRRPATRVNRLHRKSDALESSRGCLRARCKRERTVSPESPAPQRSHSRAQARHTKRPSASAARQALRLGGSPRRQSVSEMVARRLESLIICPSLEGTSLRSSLRIAIRGDAVWAGLRKVRLHCGPRGHARFLRSDICGIFRLLGSVTSRL
jgi:hypothetical protein